MSTDSCPSGLLSSYAVQVYPSESAYTASEAGYADSRIGVLLVELRKREGELSETDAAGLIKCSERRLRAIVLDTTGMSYRMLRLLVKLDIAGILLRETNLRVREISERLGYRSIKKFTLAFKRLTGFTATEYRILCLLLSRYSVLKTNKLQNGHSGGLDRVNDALVGFAARSAVFNVSRN
jgi:AraC-like DNA-binding protein